MKSLRIKGCPRCRARGANRSEVCNPVHRARYCACDVAGRPRPGDTRVVAWARSRAREGVLAVPRNGGKTVPPRTAALFKVNEEDRDWVDSMMTPQERIHYEAPLEYAPVFRATSQRSNYAVVSGGVEVWNGH